MSRASSMPEMISMGCPSASRARSRKACLRWATRRAFVPTTRTLSARMSRSRWPKRCKHARARAATSLSMRPFSSTPAARRTISRRRSMMTSWPCVYRATTRWKLLEPRSTAARTSGTGCAAGSASAFWLSRMGAAGRTRCGRSSGVEGGPAAAGRRGVGIADDELRAVQAFLVIDLRPHEVLHAHGVDQELHPLVLDAGVAVLDLLVELEAVLQAGTAAALDEDAQHQAGIAFALDELAHLAGGRVGEEQCGGFQRGFCGAHCGSELLENAGRRLMASSLEGPTPGVKARGLRSRRYPARLRSGGPAYP